MLRQFFFELITHWYISVKSLQCTEKSVKLVRIICVLLNCFVLQNDFLEVPKENRKYGNTHDKNDYAEHSLCVRFWMQVTKSNSREGCECKVCSKDKIVLISVSIDIKIVHKVVLIGNESLLLLFIKFFCVAFLNFSTDFTKTYPKGPEEVANINNNNCQSNDLENFTRHDLASDDHYVIVDVIGLTGVVFYNSVYIPFKEVFVIVHESLDVKYFSTFEHSYDLHEV